MIIFSNRHDLGHFIQLGYFEKEIALGSNNSLPLYFRLALKTLSNRMCLEIYLRRRGLHQLQVSKLFYGPRFFTENTNYRYEAHGTPERYATSQGKSLYLYPYLEDLNERFLDMVKEINCENKFVLDVNAGHGNLFKYLPKSATYFGNDIFPQNDHVHRLPDESLVGTLKQKVDVICLFGWSTGEVAVESTTQNESVRKLIERDGPQYFVLEMIAEYTSQAVAAFEHSLEKYEKIYTKHYDVGGRHPKRTLLIFKSLATQ